MEQVIKEYHDAMEAHIKAINSETVAKDKTRKTYYRLIDAKEAMRAMEREILEDSPRKLYE